MLRTATKHAFACILALGSFAVACSKHGPSAPTAGMTTPGERACRDAAETIGTASEPEPDVTCSGGKNQIVCYGRWAARCGSDDKLVELTNCRAHREVCATRSCTKGKDCDGCQTCTPGTVQCGEGGERSVCREDGSGYDPAESCDESAGQRCSIETGLCEDLCAVAETEKSYIGCDYYAVATSNSELAFDGQDADGLCQPFGFAVVVANAEGVTATVRVQSPGEPERSVTVAPSATTVIELACSPELKGERGDRYSVQTDKAAHHLTSNVPVTMYQFNPLEFKSTTTGDDGKSKTIYSYSNDASLLLPTSSLSGDYVVMSWPTLLQYISLPGMPDDGRTRSGPGFVAIIGADQKPVEVDIVSSAYTLASEDGTVPALAPGEHVSITLAPGEVFQLLSASPDECVGKPADTVNGLVTTYCRVDKDYDLTGTHIHGDGKLEVISGHDCAFVPSNRWACDHLEETMFPSESWGRQIVVSLSANVACETELPNIARVLSSADANRITFSPDVHATVTLGKGEYVEFEFTKDFVVSADAAVLVAQYLVGQEYMGIHTAGPLAKGDPSLTLAIPTEQWRKTYPFLIPATYTDNYVNIIAREHQLILIDGRVVSGFNTIKGTNVTIARLKVDPGQHLASSLGPFGIEIYGYAPFTSYMMPGGLDLQPITHVF